MTLIFTHDLNIINIHHHTKFEPPESNGSRDINSYLVIFDPMNYFLVTDGQTEGDAQSTRNCLKPRRTFQAFRQTSDWI